MDSADRFLALGEQWRTLQARLFDTSLPAGKRAEIQSQLEDIERERAALSPPENSTSKPERS